MCHIRQQNPETGVHGLREEDNTAKGTQLEREGRRQKAIGPRGNNLKGLRTLTCKPRPESGRDCLTCATFAQQRTCDRDRWICNYSFAFFGFERGCRNVYNGEIVKQARGGRRQKTTSMPLRMIEREKGGGGTEQEVGKQVFHKP